MRTEASPLRVLVVEDDRNSAFALEMLLKHEGVAATVATTGEQAIDLADTWRPQIVLLDIGLPGLDGYEVARRLRKDPATEDLLLIAVSGYGQEEDRATAIQAGFDRHLTKPADYSELRAAMAARR